MSGFEKSDQGDLASEIEKILRENMPSVYGSPNLYHVEPTQSFCISELSELPAFADNSSLMFEHDRAQTPFAALTAFDSMSSSVGSSKIIDKPVPLPSGGHADKVVLEKCIDQDRRSDTPQGSRIY